MLPLGDMSQLGRASRVRLPAPSHIRRTSKRLRITGDCGGRQPRYVGKARRGGLDRGAGGGNRTHTTLSSPRILSRIGTAITTDHVNTCPRVPRVSSGFWVVDWAAIGPRA